MKANVNIKLHNRFDVEVKNMITGEIRQRAVAYNILLNNIYTRLCSRNTYFDSIRFGSGTGALSPTRTDLFTPIATVAATTVEILKDVANNIYYWKRKIVLAPSDYVGQTITEVGIYGGTTNSHALIKDAEGNPISITKTAIDEITIYATVYIQLSTNGPAQFVNLPNNNYLINYLLGCSFTTPSIEVGTCGGPISPYGLSTFNNLLSKSVTLTADTANKRFYTSTVRYQTTEANSPLAEIGLTKICRVITPIEGIWNGQDFADVSLGAGDGATTTFDIPNIFPDNDSIVVKVNGVVASNYTKTKKISRTYAKSFIEVLPSYYSNAGNSVMDVGDVFHEGANTYVILGASAFYSTRNYGPYLYFLKGTKGAYNVIQKPYVPSDTSDQDPIQVTFTHDGNYVIANITHNLYVYRRNGDQLTYLGPADVQTGNLEKFKISADDSLLIAPIGSTTTLAVYKFDKTTGALTKYTTITGAVNASYESGDVAISPDKKYLINVGTYNTVGDIFKNNGDDTFTKIRSLPSGATSSQCCDFSPDGKYVAIGIGNSPYIMILKNNNDDTFTQLTAPSAHTPGSPKTMKFSVTGKYLIATTYASNGACLYAVDSVADTFTSLGAVSETNTSGMEFGMVCEEDSCYFIGHWATGSNAALVVHDMHPDITSITFDSPPANGDAITADYHVDYIPKTSDYVLDISFSIQYGEGV